MNWEMQYFSNWPPKSPPPPTPTGERERRTSTPPLIERTKLKSEPSRPLLSSPIFFPEEYDEMNGERAEKTRARISPSSYEALAKHRMGGRDFVEVKGEEFGMEVTTASIHPSEASYSSPYRNSSRDDYEDEDRSPTPGRTPKQDQINHEDLSNEPGPTIDPVHGMDMTFAEALTTSPGKSPPEDDTNYQHNNLSNQLQTVIESPAPATINTAIEDDPTLAPNPPSPTPALRRRSLLPFSSGHKRFSTGSMSVHFSSPLSTSPPLSSAHSSAQTPTTATAPSSASAAQLDRINALLTKTATQLHALERVQAANWERAVSMLVENAAQISELRRGQEKLGAACEELRKVVELQMETSKRRSGEQYEIRKPPRKMGRRIIGYVYEPVESSSAGSGDGRSPTVTPEKKLQRKKRAD